MGIVLSHDEDEAMRRIPARFVVRPGHIEHDIKRKATLRLDPRRRSAESSSRAVRF